MSEEKIRLLICHTCKSIDPLPGYDGPVDDDVLLEFKTSEHRFPDGNAHFGQLALVDKKDWDNKNIKNAIISKINETLDKGETGMGSEYYALKSSFQEDAMNCWKAHSRTTNCEDYHSESKRLVPDTAHERKELGLSVKDRPNTFLCDFCPYESVVMQRRRKARGDYK